MEGGYTEINRDNREIALDYVRGGLFDPKDMKPLPNVEPGPDNDLYEKLTFHVQKAIENEDYYIFAYGERWRPERKEDKYFHFKPGNGIHDIHMNQGNSAFQSQSWCTDDETGHALKECSHEEHEETNAAFHISDKLSI